MFFVGKSCELLENLLYYPMRKEGEFLMTEEKRVWGIHTLDNELFMRENVIAIGWREMGDLGELNDRAAFKEKFARVYPKATKQGVANSAGCSTALQRKCKSVIISSIHPSRTE